MCNYEYRLAEKVYDSLIIILLIYLVHLTDNPFALLYSTILSSPPHYPTAHYSTSHYLLPVSGIIPRVVEALFTAVTEADESIEFTFKVTYVEIYMEKIRDLLDESRVKVTLFSLLTVC